MPNITPIFSKVADIQGGVVLTANNGNEFTGASTNNVIVFQADPTNGGFIQRLRFKALGTNAVTVARVYINGGNTNSTISYDPNASIIPAPGTPAGVASGSGGTLATQNLFCKVIAQDQYGNWSAASAENANVAVTGPTGSITWTWNSSAGAIAYRAYVGVIASGESNWFVNTAAQTCLQTVAYISGQQGKISSLASLPNFYYGEVSLPATTLSVSSATTEIDYPMNFALPPNARVLVGLGNTVAGGWAVTGIGGRY